MRIRRRRQSKDITGAFCATCHGVRDVERVEPQAGQAMFVLACGHTVTLHQGATYGLNVRADEIVLYPNPADLPARHEGVV